MSSTILKHATQTGAILALFAIVGTAFLVATHFATKDIIAESERQAKLELISQIVPRNAFDNDIIKDAAALPAAPEIGNREPSTVYRATREGKPVAAVLEAAAPDGYSGRIKFIIAIKADGAISGVRVIEHHETPGLGDYIEIAKSQWITIFDGNSLTNPPDKDWRVKKDGGKFEHNTGATVTPRAMIKAVHKTLEYFRKNRDKIFALPASTQEPAK